MSVPSFAGAFLSALFGPQLLKMTASDACPVPAVPDAVHLAAPAKRELAHGTAHGARAPKVREAPSLWKRSWTLGFLWSGRKIRGNYSSRVYMVRRLRSSQVDTIVWDISYILVIVIPYEAFFGGALLRHVPFRPCLFHPFSM